MRKTAVLLAAAGIVAAVSVPSTAEIPPPVIVRTTGVCDTGYRVVVQAGNVVVCISNSIRAPRVRPTVTGCSAGETAYLVDNRYGVCTS